MAEKKGRLFLSAVSAMLVACGGGSADTPVNAPASAAGASSAAGAPTVTAGAPGTATGSASAAAALALGNTNAGNPAQTNNSAIANSAPSSAPSAPADQLLAGYLTMVANSVVFIRTDRVIYLPVSLTEFESGTGIAGVASGSATAHVDIDVDGAHCNPAIDGLCGIQPPAPAPAAPLAAFGIRISRYVQPSTPGQAIWNQTVVGRIAVDLTERPGSPGILANEAAEIMRFVIDAVELSTDENGILVSAKVRDGAQIHVYGRNAAGVEVRENISAPAGTIRLLPLSQVPDNGGDTGSVILLLDLETGFSQAGQKLAALQNIAGQFSMHVTLSSIADIVRPAAPAANGFPALEREDLAGQQITVNEQPPVSGAGVNGNVWIRSYPPK